MVRFLHFEATPETVETSLERPGTIRFFAIIDGADNVYLTITGQKEQHIMRPGRGKSEYEVEVTITADAFPVGSSSQEYTIEAASRRGFDARIGNFTVVVDDPRGGDPGGSDPGKPDPDPPKDTTPPTIHSFVSNAPSDRVALRSSASSIPQTIRFTVEAEDESGISSVSVDNGAFVTQVNAPIYNFEKTFSYADYPYNQTPVTFTCTAIDSNGLSNTSQLVIIVDKQDDVDPIISSFTASPSTVTFPSGTGQTVVRFSANATDNYIITANSLQDNRGTTYSLINQSGSLYEWNIIIDAGNYAAGTTNVPFTVSFTDDNSNTATQIYNLPITVCSYETVTPSNSISLTANLNKSVFESGSYLGMRTHTIAHTNSEAYRVAYDLPTGSLTLPLGDISALLPSGKQGGVFNAFLDITSSADGSINGSVRITGSNVTATIQEDVNLAQVVAWESESPQPTVTGSSDDRLSSTIGSLDVASHLSSTISAIEEAYNQNALSGWTFQITGITAQNGSLISQYAIANNRTYPDIFEAGERIVLETTYPYSVTITDVNGVEQTIVSESPIHAVVTHDHDAPPL